MDKRRKSSYRKYLRKLIIFLINRKNNFTDNIAVRLMFADDIMMWREIFHELNVEQYQETEMLKNIDERIKEKQNE